MFRRFTMGPLLEAAGGDGAGAGGGAGDAKPLTADEVAKIANQAITAQIKRLGIDDKFTALSTGIDTKLAELVTKLTPAQTPEPKPGDKPAIDPLVQKQLDTFAAQLKASEEARKAAEEAVTAEKTQRLFDNAKLQLSTALKEAAHPDLHDVWVDSLVHGKRLKLAEDGSPLLEVEHAPVRGMPKEKQFLPLTEAVTHLLEEPQSKKFKAVPGGGPVAGNRGPADALSSGKSSLESKDPLERADALLRKISGVGLDQSLEH